MEITNTGALAIMSVFKETGLTENEAIGTYFIENDNKIACGYAKGLGQDATSNTPLIIFGDDSYEDGQNGFFNGDKINFFLERDGKFYELNTNDFYWHNSDMYMLHEYTVGNEITDLIYVEDEIVEPEPIELPKETRANYKKYCNDLTYIIQGDSLKIQGTTYPSHVYVRGYTLTEKTVKGRTSIVKSRFTEYYKSVDGKIDMNVDVQGVSGLYVEFKSIANIKYYSFSKTL